MKPIHDRGWSSDRIRSQHRLESVPEAVTAPVPAATIRLAIIGDSLSAGRPRQAPPTQGAPDLTWVDVLALTGRADLGGWQAERPGRPGPGWGHLWAAWGVTNGAVLEKPWLDEVVARRNDLDAVLIFLGHNELFPLISRDLLAQPAVFAQRLDAVSRQYASELAQILDRLVLAFGQRVHLMLAADWNGTPLVKSIPMPRADALRLTDATHRLRDCTMQAAVIRGLPVIDAETVLRRLVDRPILTVGGVDIATNASLGTATAGFLPDAVHCTTVLHGHLANAVIDHLALHSGKGLPRLSETDLLDLAGIARTKIAIRPNAP